MRAHPWLPACVLLLAACGDDSSSETHLTGAITSASATATAASDSAGATSSGGEGSTGDGSTGDGSTSEPATSATTSTSTTSTSTTSTSTTTTDGGSSSTGEPSEYVMIEDPLKGGTIGAAVGGSFGPDGWTVTAKADRVYWALPRLVEGSVEFTMSNVTLDNMPLNDHEVFAMYEGGHGIGHPIDYAPEYRTNAYKSMIRIYGTAEAQRIGKQKLMWGLCPMGAPGYYDTECPCADPVGFFEEPFGGDGTWDGTPQVLRVEWADGKSRYLRNGEVILEIDWSDTGLSFAPDALYMSLGTPRAEKIDSAGMPIGAVFSDVKIEGWTGPAADMCL
ncbi:MAG: hypothetical protein KC420_00210 [Myxococcales bacterium]|nr:hypothetical protein [Myxococcales bacterium]MCB9569014.1 hypothetical protein [Myxococcales bacterium]MCB9701072.1 hypothetical protein [Myxococcales bacterium]